MNNTRLEPGSSPTSPALTDVLIIGSGFGGAPPALRLAEAGLRVHVVERGERLGAADIRRTQNPRYLQEHILSTGGPDISLTHVHAYGGAAPFYEMVSLRSPTAAFDQQSDGGARLWPRGLGRESLDPYYDRAEKTMAVRQLEPERIPKTGQVFARLMGDLGLDAARLPLAVGNCRGTGFCVTGCVFHAKRGPDVKYLPRAEAAGAVVSTGWQARDIRPLEGAFDGPAGGPMRDVPYRYEVTCARADNGDAGMRTRHIRTKLLIVASGTVGTAGLLLRNRHVLTRMSEHVGRNVAFNASSKVVAVLPDRYPDVDNYRGETIPGVASYALLRSHGLVMMPAKPLPVQLVASARFREPGDEGLGEYWGPDNVAFMRRYRRRGLVVIGLATAPPLARIRCRRGSGRESDELGVEVQSESALRQMQRIDHTNTKAIRGILARAGCKIVDITPTGLDGSPRDGRQFGSAHHVGSCRMADSPLHGAVDSVGELFGHPGIHVTDGAAIPAAPGVNPSLTILANAERITEALCARYSTGG